MWRDEIGRIIAGTEETEYKILVAHLVGRA
jgi:hypothetical protein